MELRDLIIKELDVINELPETSLYNKLKSCIIFKSPNFDDYSEEGDKIEASFNNWFRGVISSLFYKPNENLLIFCGDKGIGKSYFFDNLFPDKGNLGVSAIKTSVYNSMILEIEHNSKANTISAIKDICFKVNKFEEGKPSCDKRLASYYITQNQKWHLPQRKDICVINVDSIDIKLFESIDKLKLWQEIFYIFKNQLNEN